MGVLEAELDIWDDRRIAKGDAWLPEIQGAMDRASVAVLLISKDFLTSNFIKDKEVPHLLKRRREEGLRVSRCSCVTAPGRRWRGSRRSKVGRRMRSRSPITGGLGPRRSSLTWR